MKILTAKGKRFLKISNFNKLCHYKHIKSLLIEEGDSVDPNFDYNLFYYGGEFHLRGLKRKELSYELEEVLFLDSSVKILHSASFFFFIKLKNVILPRNLLHLNSWVFSNCNGLERIKLPDTITLIGKRAFQNCESLREVNIPKSVKKIGKSAFMGSDLSGFIEIPKSCKIIEERAFEMCTSLKEVYFHERKGKLIIFGEKTFKYSGLKSIKLPEGLHIISSECFNRCKDLIQVTLPNSINIISSNAFSYCTKLKKVIIPERVTNIYSFAFYECVSLEEVVIKGEKCYVRASSFGNCKSLKKVIFNPNSKINYIEDSTFNGCSKLEEINLPDKIATIGNFAFKGTNLKKIKLPSGLGFIGNGAFKDCLNLEEVIISSKHLSSVMYDAFSGCSNLKAIYLASPTAAIDEVINACRRSNRWIKVYYLDELSNKHIELL